MAETAGRLGSANEWRPADGSNASDYWNRIRKDPLALTLCEGDVHATLLLRSGIDHAATAAKSLSAGSPFLPHTLGRTAAEHLARAQHHLDPKADDGERAVRRLNELAYAIEEAAIRRASIIEHGHVTEADAGASRGVHVDDLIARAAALGHTIKTTGRARVEGTGGRASSMNLVETYTAGGAAGIPSFTTRNASAILHGTELGLGACTRDDPNTSTVSPGVNVPIPTPMSVGNLAFNLLGVPLTLINSIEAAQERFAWPETSKAHAAHAAATQRLIDAWFEVLNTDEDVVS